MNVQDWLLAALAVYVVQTLLPPTLRYMSRGMGLGQVLGPRDDPPPQGVIGGRLARALANMTEAMMVFTPIALLVILRGVETGWAASGAALFVLARLAYVAAYASGIPGLRSAVWAVGHAGIGVMVLALLGRL